MELQTTSRRIGTIETVFDDLDERPVDCDFMLPDYLPDIAAVLKCVMKPMVQSHQLSGDRVMVDGTVYLQLLYLDEARRCVRSFEYSQPFTSAFTVKDLKSSDSIRLSARTNYVNCRPTSPRRVDVHGAFSVHLVVTAETGMEVLTGAEGEGLHTRGCTVSGSVPAGSGRKTITLNEVLELGSTPAQALIRTEAVPCIAECRQMPGKAVIKGDVLLQAVYVTDTEAGTLCRSQHRIPFSQILDVDGLTEEQLCQCRAELLQCDARLAQDPGGENRLLSVALRVELVLDCYRTESCEILTDAYHTDFPLKNETCRMEPCHITVVRTDPMTINLSEALPDGDIAEIVDLWCDTLPVDCRCEEGQVTLDGRLLVGMLTRGSDGVLSYYERPAEYALNFADECQRMNAEVMLTDVAYSQNGAQLELRLQANVSRMGMQLESCLPITRMVADESAPYAVDNALKGCCLKACFALAGESVWELARREHTSPEMLREENGLAGDVLEQDTMLLIPLNR